MLSSDFVRFHKKPKRCRRKKEAGSVRAQYYADQSYKRYLETEDGKTINRLAGPVLQNGSIGEIDNFLLYVTG